MVSARGLHRRRRLDRREQRIDPAVLHEPEGGGVVAHCDLLDLGRVEACTLEQQGERVLGVPSERGHADRLALELGQRVHGGIGRADHVVEHLLVGHADDDEGRALLRHRLHDRERGVADDVDVARRELLQGQGSALGELQVEVEAVGLGEAAGLGRGVGDEVDAHRERHHDRQLRELAGRRSGRGAAAGVLGSGAAGLRVAPAGGEETSGSDDDERGRGQLEEGTAVVGHGFGVSCGLGPGTSRSYERVLPARVMLGGLRSMRSPPPRSQTAAASTPLSEVRSSSLTTSRQRSSVTSSERRDLERDRGAGRLVLLDELEVAGPAAEAGRQVDLDHAVEGLAVEADAGGHDLADAADVTDAGASPQVGDAAVARHVVAHHAVVVVLDVEQHPGCLERQAGEQERIDVGLVTPGRGGE